MSIKKLLFVLTVIGLLAVGYPLKAEADLVGPFVADSAESTEAQKFVFQLIPSLFIKQGIFNEEGTRRYLPSGDRQNQFITVLKPIYGLFNNFEISLEVPVQYNWTTRSEQSAQTGGLGDLLLGGKYRFVESDKNGFFPSMAAVAKIKFPTGKFEKLEATQLGSDRISNGSYEYTLGLNLSKIVKDWAFHLNLWYDWVNETTIDNIKTKPGNIFLYSLATEYTVTKRWSLLLELNGREQGANKENDRTLQNSESPSVSLLPAIGWDMHEKFSLLIGCSITVLGKNADFGYTPMLVMTYNF